ncbi:MAG TPA: thiamine-phosphate kinase [Chloroflexota bacterium]|nr:thiamine-phosphate kinase [Chloroflexota bacterium]
MRVRDIGEFGLIDRLVSIVGESGDGVVTGIGDDTAVLRLDGDKYLLATCDVQVDGVHFVADRAPPGDVGHKSLAVNLSDIAAMGGRPRWALVSLGLAPSTSVGYVEELYRGMQALATRSGLAIVGGNISRAGGAIFVDVTVLGEVSSDRVIRRSGARPGDVIAVTGTLGDSAAGLALALDQVRGADRQARSALVERHRRPEPRIKAGQVLAESGVITAMMDISDGLAQDLGHMCQASGVGAQVDAARLPLSTALLSLAGIGFDPLRAALYGGEDYELLFTVRPDRLDEVAATVARAGGPAVTAIGIIVEENLSLQMPDGQLTDLSPEGHDHLSGRAMPVKPRPETTRRHRRR